MSDGAVVLFSDSDMEFLVDSLDRDLSPESVVSFENRLAIDPDFRAFVVPVIIAWTMPRPFKTFGLWNWIVRLFGFTPNYNSAKTRQAPWDRLFRGEGMKPKPMIKFLDAAYKPQPRWRKTVRVVRRATAAAALAYLVWYLTTAYQLAVARTLEGRSLPEAAAVLKPRVYEASNGTAQEVRTRVGTVTLEPGSRLSIGWPLNSSAIDGEAVIVVPPGKKFLLKAADVSFALIHGRYHVSHALGERTRIFVDSGVANIMDKTRYPMGTLIIAEPMGPRTTITATLKDGSKREPKVVRAFGMRPD